MLYYMDNYSDWVKSSFWDRWKYRHRGWPEPDREEVKRLAAKYDLPMIEEA